MQGCRKSVEAWEQKILHLGFFIVKKGQRRRSSGTLPAGIKDTG